MGIPVPGLGEEVRELFAVVVAELEVEVEVEVELEWVQYCRRSG